MLTPPLLEPSLYLAFHLTVFLGLNFHFKTEVLIHPSLLVCRIPFSRRLPICVTILLPEEFPI